MVRRLKSETRRTGTATTAVPGAGARADRGRLHRRGAERPSPQLQRYAELRQANGAGRRRAVRHRVRAQDAEEAALLLARLRSSHTLDAAREVAPRTAQEAEGGRRADAASCSGELDRVDEDYADDERVRGGRPTTPSSTRHAPSSSELGDEERGSLRELKDWAERASARRRRQGQAADRAGSNETLRPGGEWSDERVIIFTEYRATQNWLQELLAAERLHRAATGSMTHVRRHGHGGARADQGRVPGRPEGVARPHPAGHRRRLRRHRPPEPLLPADPLRDPVEPEPPGAAQRPHRPPRPEGRARSSSTTSSARATTSGRRSVRPSPATSKPTSSS